MLSKSLKVSDRVDHKRWSGGWYGVLCVSLRKRGTEFESKETRKRVRPQNGNDSCVGERETGQVWS